jgi:Undecaprenyl-phosphate glucose phosphotransferase
MSEAIVSEPATTTLVPASTARGNGSEARAVSPEILTTLVRAAEFGLVATLGLALKAAYVDPASSAPDEAYLAAILIAAVSISATLGGMGLYSLSALRHAWRQSPRVWLAWTIVFALLLAGAFFMKVGQEFSRGWLGLWYALGGASLLVARAATASLVQRLVATERLQRRAVIVGGGHHADELIRALESDPESDIRIAGIFDDRGPERGGGAVAGYPKLGNIDELIDYGRTRRIDMLIVALPLTAENRLLQILKKLWVLPVDIRLSAHASKLRFRPRAYSYAGRVPLLDLIDRPIANWQLVQKWLFDKVVGTVALILLAPVMAAVAVAIRLDSRGPVLFRQKRYGFNNELIEVYKFRSMYVDKSDANAARLVTKGDPRVTPVGRFIRKTSLDELPQLFNVVFKGDLSLVGPRPHALQAKAADQLYQDVVDGYFARHKVKPGLTGWAQINGWRGETDTAEKIQKRVEHDLAYIENWSLLSDLYICAATPFALLKAENAY